MFRNKILKLWSRLVKAYERHGDNDLLEGYGPWGSGLRFAPQYPEQVTPFAQAGVAACYLAEPERRVMSRRWW
jgi:hypothetical protein